MKGSMLFQEKDIPWSLVQCQRAKESTSVRWAKSAILRQDLIWLTASKVQRCTFVTQSVFCRHRNILAAWDVLCQHLFYKPVVSRICHSAIIEAHKRFRPTPWRKYNSDSGNVTWLWERPGSFLLAECQSWGKGTKEAKSTLSLGVSLPEGLAHTIPTGDLVQSSVRSEFVMRSSQTGLQRLMIRLWPGNITEHNFQKATPDRLETTQVAEKCWQLAGSQRCTHIESKNKDHWFIADCTVVNRNYQ